MGKAKEQMEKADIYYNYAKAILNEIGAISICNVCGIYYFNTFSLDESVIYARATNRLKEKYPKYNEFAEFHNQVNRVMKEAGLESTCPHCWKD